MNWSASFRTPDHVRREWARKYALPVFEGARFDAALDAVCKRIGVSTGVEQGRRPLRSGMRTVVSCWIGIFTSCAHHLCDGSSS